MPKRKKQTQPQLPPQVPEREEAGDGGDGRPAGPPSLLGPPPMANGKPGDPKSEFPNDQTMQKESLETLILFITRWT